jgi:hypothetical protein
MSVATGDAAGAVALPRVGRTMRDRAAPSAASPGAGHAPA